MNYRTSINNRTCQKNNTKIKSASFATDHLNGEKNGKKYGMKSSIVVENVEKIKKMHAALIFPNQLFENSPLLDSACLLYTSDAADE